VKEDINDLIGAIYDCALDSGGWPEILTRIADRCGAENAALVMVDPRLNLSVVLAPRADPDVISAYGEHWWQHDPTSAATAGVAPGVLTDLSHTGRDVFLNSAFHNEYWCKSGLGAERIASNLFTDGTSFGSFVLQTAAQRDELTQDMFQTMRILVPHLVRSVQFQRRSLHLSASLVAASFNDTDGIILVDQELRVLWADAEAESQFAENSAFRIAAGRLVLPETGVQEQLVAAVWALMRPARLGPAQTTLALTCPLTGAPISLEVILHNALRAVPGPFMTGGADVAALIVINHPQRRAARRLAKLCTRYGLTRAEARLALEIARGDGRAAAAERAGISVNTARTHLASIFGKMGVHRQAELISKIADI
jgi:DNA-binding CsgD family transcriptional regulator